jgi:hypothetical protein
MQFSQPVRMADGEGSPVWARSRKRGGIPIVGLLVTLLALFGALTAVLGIKEQSLAAGGAVVDGWITTGWDSAKSLVGQAPAAADEAAAEAGAAAAKAGDAIQAGAETTANEMKK